MKYIEQKLIQIFQKVFVRLVVILVRFRDTYMFVAHCRNFKGSVVLQPDNE